MTKAIAKIRPERIPRHIKLMRRVTKTDHCWLWTGAKNESGYGVMEINDRLARCHRISYELFVGEIPEGMFVCHKCDVPSCIRPDHLFLGTPAENSADMKNKGRGRGPRKLSVHQVQEIKVLLSIGAMSQRVIADHYSVNQSTISDIKTGAEWSEIKP